LLADLTSAIGFSSFGVLLYYLIANAAAYTQSPERRRFPRILQVVGIVGCGTLVLTLPVRAVLGGTVVFAVGIVYRAIRVRYSRPRT
jgi:basic amino acid/polyamine antiporter, APA family